MIMESVNDIPNPMTITEKYIQKILPYLAGAEGGTVQPKSFKGLQGHEFPCPFCSVPVAVRKDDVSAAIHAAIANVAGLGSISGCGGLIQTTSG